MSGPANPNPRGSAWGTLEELERSFAGKGWEFFAQSFDPAKVHDHFEPSDQLKMHLAAMMGTETGRALLDWLMELTCKAPYPTTIESIEALAFAAAKHQARAAVGEVILKAANDGRRLLDLVKR